MKYALSIAIDKLNNTFELNFIWNISANSKTNRVNSVCNYHKHKYVFLFIDINYMATCYDGSFVTFRLGSYKEIKLQLQIHFTVGLRSQSFV